MNLIAPSTPRLLLALAVGFTMACSPADRSDVEVEEEATSRDAAATSGYADLTVEQLRDLLAEGRDPVLVNVHVPNRGDIPGTDLRIPFDEIGQRAGEIPGGKGAQIVLYCRSGNMSRTAAETLVAEGYTDVYNVEGGRRAWQAAGY